MEISPEERRRIEQFIKEMADPLSEANHIVRLAIAEIQSCPEFRKLQQSIEDSTFITAADLALVINTR